MKVHGGFNPCCKMLTNRFSYTPGLTHVQDPLHMRVSQMLCVKYPRTALWCSLHSYWAFLLHLDETPLDVLEHWFIAAIFSLNSSSGRLIQNRLNKDKSQIPYEQILGSRKSYWRASPLYACVACWSCAPSCMTSADNASTLLCSFAS